MFVNTKCGYTVILTDYIEYLNDILGAQKLQ